MFEYLKLQTGLLYLCLMVVSSINYYQYNSPGWKARLQKAQIRLSFPLQPFTFSHAISNSAGF